MKHLEDAAQAEVIRWARMREKTAPELELLYHVPNGGNRGMLEAKRLKAQGVLPGVPDLHLPIARGKFIGLWVEMKSPTGVLSKDQKTVGDALRKQRHRVEVCRSVVEAISVIESYLKEGSQ